MLKPVLQNRHKPSRLEVLSGICKILHCLKCKEESLF